MVKIKHISEKENRAIQEYEEILLARFPHSISRLMLFGSKARGNSHRSSDVDILVVLTKNGKRITREIAALTHEPIAHFGVLLSPIIVEEQFFKEWSPLLEHIKKEGITLWKTRAKKNMCA
jgi:uncharacterized protein